MYLKKKKKKSAKEVATKISANINPKKYLEYDLITTEVLK